MDANDLNKLLEQSDNKLNIFANVELTKSANSEFRLKYCCTNANIKQIVRKTTTFFFIITKI